MAADLDVNTRGAARYGIVTGALTLAAIAVSSYLTYAHYTTAANLACSDKGLINCAKVTTSSYSSQLGIPLAVVGLAFFAVMLAFQNPWAWRSVRGWVRFTRLGLAAGGAVTALWLIWVELFRLDAICVYCTVVHVLAIVIFILTVLGTAAITPNTEVEDDTDRPETGPSSPAMAPDTALEIGMHDAGGDAGLVSWRATTPRRTGIASLRSMTTGTWIAWTLDRRSSCWPGWRATAGH
jgi:uncharacterized membrane protein